MPASLHVRKTNETVISDDSEANHRDKATYFLIFRTWVASSFSPLPSFSLSSSMAFSCGSEGTRESSQH